ncbi:molybdopterin-containing oxidoreductase family protein [Mesoterricola silvestris]|uniref:Formate dehydrogenase n=1 Tax=Mesoterricola silvestris TaxID=2927979 RepID=A0AA48GZY9_9BACT|nr:molybdopterin-dependent oxidoreductase [Mesoterricola silvestris]BDU73483.1 formate dehydrogenase [Mesoterricola silvestris]
MDRRLFLQLVGAGGFAATSIGCPKFFARAKRVPEPPVGPGVPTTCELCPNKCSVLATVRRGRIHKLNPNPENPKSRNMLCARGNAAIQQVYDPDRLKQPMIRVGARGEGKWKAATWDEAFDFAAKKLAETKAKHGPEGTLWSSTEGFQEVFFKNLGLAFGSPNILRHPSLCLASVNLAYSMTFGTVPSFDLQNAKYVIMAGANRFESIITPDTMDLIGGVMERKAKFVYLDPRFTVTASKADEWYPIKPGTDMAFILAMIHVIIREDRCDKAFLDQWTLGFDQLVEHVKPYTPEFAEAETGIPAREITRIAREFADAGHRAVFYAGRRSSWYQNDFQMRRAQAILNTIVGNWDREGGMVPNRKVAKGEFMFLPWDDPKAPRVDEVEKNFPLTSAKDGVYLQTRENVLKGAPYPVKAWMIYKQDPLNAVPDQGKTLRMMEAMDFIGVVDIAMSDTAWYADVVFPESHYLERTDPIEVMPGIWPAAVLRQQVIKPIHDTLPMLEIAQGLARRLGLSEYFDYTIDQWIEAEAKELPVENGLEYMKKHGVVAFSEPKYGTTRNAAYRFVTKSGKIEIFSERLAEAGHDPLPVYAPPAQPPAGRFRMILGRKATITHAALAGLPWLHEQIPENDLWINQDQASRMGIRTGDLVEVTSTAGTVRIKARATEEIRPDCVFMLHGFGKKSPWLKRVYNVGAADAVLLETAWDKVSGNAAMHETFVNVVKV